MRLVRVENEHSLIGYQGRPRRGASKLSDARRRRRVRGSKLAAARKNTLRRTERGRKRRTRVLISRVALFTCRILTLSSNRRGGGGS